MKKSKKHSDNSTRPTKRDPEPENRNLDIKRRTLPQILKMLTFKQPLVVILPILITIVVTFFKAGVEYQNHVIGKDKQILELKEKNEVSSVEKNRLEKDKQQLNNTNDTLQQRNNTLKQHLQNAINELNNRKEEIKRLNVVIDSLKRVPPKPHDTTSYEVIIDLSDFGFQIPYFSIFLNDTLKAQGEIDIFRLSAPEGVYNLKIQYKDNARRIKEFNNSIIFNGSTSKIHIDKSKFALKH